MDIMIGQKYKIKKNFFKLRSDDDPGICNAMVKLAGQEMIVKEVWGSDNQFVRVFENTWCWYKEWLEPVEPELEIKEITDNDLVNLVTE